MSSLLLAPLRQMILPNSELCHHHEGLQIATPQSTYHGLAIWAITLECRINRGRELAHLPFITIPPLWQ